VQEALAGDRRALDTLLRRHYPLVYGLCRRMTGNDADAADAAQDALVAAVRGLSRFDGRSRFSTWMYRVTTNVCLDELRRRRRRPEPREELPSAPAAGALDSAVADRVDVDAALRSLPPEFRAAVVLRDLCGLDYDEIATVLGIPPGTVRSRISRGRAAVADRLGNPDRPDRRPTSRP
jgi:RNA polymerase sigma-70 factor (ECF subfamily)